MLSDIENFLDTVDIPKEAVEPNKRQELKVLIEKGHKLPGKTSWTIERLNKASDNVIDKLFEGYKNPPGVKINKGEALEIGRPMVPIIIEMYCEGIGEVLKQTPYIGTRYQINVAKLKKNISSNDIFCDNLAIKIGSKMIEQIGQNNPMRMGISLASMTYDAVEAVVKIDAEISPLSNSDSDKKKCEGELEIDKTNFVGEEGPVVV